MAFKLIEFEDDYIKKIEDIEDIIYKYEVKAEEARESANIRFQNTKTQEISSRCYNNLAKEYEQLAVWLKDYERLLKKENGR